MIPQSKWVWYGSAAHFCCGEWCHFHLTTRIGRFVVSTVGELRHPSKTGASEQSYAAYRNAKPLGENLADTCHCGCGEPRACKRHRETHPVGEEIGSDRCFETMVFKIKGQCSCGCGLPTHTGSECDFAAYGNRKAANVGHLEMCLRWARKQA